jgi:uncharacterized protein (DUF433 family)
MGTNFLRLMLGRPIATDYGISVETVFRALSPAGDTRDSGSTQPH